MEDYFSAHYWDSIVQEYGNKRPDAAWRTHIAEIYGDLIYRWFKGVEIGLTLKTDLFDEAVCDNNPMSRLNSNMGYTIGMDVSPEITRLAVEKIKKNEKHTRGFVCATMEHLAFKLGTFDRVLSYSTLDHFPSKENIFHSLSEIRRIMKAGGILILTLDNPRHPVILIRNKIPYQFLKRSGLIPYYMGETMSLKALVRALNALGFRVCESTAVIHSPRIVAIWIGHIVDRMGNAKIRRSFLNLLKRLERLENLPVKYVTGHFIAIKAIKI